MEKSSNAQMRTYLFERERASRKGRFLPDVSSIAHSGWRQAGRGGLLESDLMKSELRGN